ncbi:MAG: TadE/TadG family type IV pilus assembly protein [Acidimicrobiales bacterium]
MSCRTRSRDERGAVVVEAALVLPLLLMLLFGIIEVGGAIKSYSSAANAARAGGRMASVAGNEAMADQQILERVAGEASGLPNGEIEYVIIWNSTGVGETPPAACIAAAGAASAPNTSPVGVYDGGNSTKGACNVYIRPDAPGGAFQMARGELASPPEFYFGCLAPGEPNKVDCNWSPKNRKVRISPRVLPVGTPEANRLTPDYVGVFVRASHDYYTGIIGSTLTITEGSVNLLEPDNFGVNT